MSHHVNKCKHGVQLGQCRCAAPNKEVRLVMCPPSHQDWPETEHPVKYTGTYGMVAVESEPDREALVRLIKRIFPIKHDPLATVVAEEWADEFLEEG